MWGSQSIRKPIMPLPAALLLNAAHPQRKAPEVKRLPGHRWSVIPCLGRPTPKFSR